MLPVALQIGEGLVVLVGMGLLLVAVLILVAVFASTEHRKEMALIESGQYATESVQPAPWVLAAGLLLLAIGLANVVRAAWLGTVPDEGLTLTALGLAALGYYWFRRRQTRDAGAETGDYPLMLQTGYVRATLSPMPSASETRTTSSMSL